jgi:hypothetical protein
LRGQYLTVPYLRIPLVVSFFASDDRIHALQSQQLQRLFDAVRSFSPTTTPPGGVPHAADRRPTLCLHCQVLFEPGHHLPLKAAGIEPVDVPTSAPKLLGTAHHLLINELCRSPDTLLNSITRLMKQVRRSRCTPP